MAEYSEVKARREVNATMAASVAIAGAGALLPGTSLVLSAAEIRMVGVVAKAYGLKIEGQMWGILLKAILLKLGGASVLKKIAIEATTLLGPFAFVVKPSIAAGVVKGIVEACIVFFEERFPNQKVGKRPTWEKFLDAFNGPDENERDLYNYWSQLADLT